MLTIESYLHITRTVVMNTYALGINHDTHTHTHVFGVYTDQIYRL